LARSYLILTLRPDLLISPTGCSLLFDTEPFVEEGSAQADIYDVEESIDEIDDLEKELDLSELDNLEKELDLLDW